ncbi:MAG TPA: TIGR03668 family PPOX class F420-dependent oxidoreductase [Nakamurella sp.]|nr:TIGR03668 family PPOX class F420-dependent oxidoreductase [Nakamurella sp.]
MRMTLEAARDRFLTARVARLATVGADGAPHIVPVTFAVVQIEDEQADDAEAGQPTIGTAEVIVFGVDHKPKSTLALRRLANIVAEPRVAFLADHYDEDWSALWWVRVEATAHIVTGSTRGRAVQALAHRYPQYAALPPEGPVVGSWVTHWSGWQATEH